jgi:hypothetical protein
LFSLIVDADGVYKKFDLAVDRVQDLDRPLKKFGAHLKRRAIERYKGQNFAPLARATLEARGAKGLRSLERKLSGDVRKAQRRAGGEPLPKGLLGRALAIIAAEPAPIAAGMSRGVRNRQSVLQTFQEQQGFRHGSRKNQSILMSAGAAPLSLKAQASLDKRTERAVAKAVNKPILGGLPGTLEVEVSLGSVTLRSHTDKPWTAVHNDGGAAGNSATIPKRETVRVDESDLAVLAELLKEHVLGPLED